MESLPGWSEIELAGHPCDVFQPATPNEHRFVVLYLHGVHVRRLNCNEPFTAAFARHGLSVISPITGESWWTDRICEAFDASVTPERYLLDVVVPYIRERWDSGPPKIALLGTSMGGQGALRLAFKHPDTFPVVCALSPAIDYQSRWQEGDRSLRQMYESAEAVRQDTATLHIHPLNWPRNIFFACCPNDERWIESADRLRMKLSALGIPHDCDLDTEGGSHGEAYYNKMADTAVDFLAERLDRERRRIV